MKAAEIIDNFMKGNFKVSISEKQKSWLVSQAKKEGLTGSGSCSESVYFEDCFYSISPCKRLASGGSYVGTKIIQGRYNLEKKFFIKFQTGDKITAVYGQTDLEHFRREGYLFDIIKPIK